MHIINIQKKIKIRLDSKITEWKMGVSLDFNYQKVSENYHTVCLWREYVQAWNCDIKCVKCIKKEENDLDNCAFLLAFAKCVVYNENIVTIHIWLW